MKTAVAFIAMMGVLLMGCNDNPDSILKDEQVRKEIFADILNNHQYLTELMDSMRTNGHARMMIHSDTTMAHSMMRNMPTEKMLNHLMDKTEKDSMACKMMCGAMMGHKKMMKTMLDTLGRSGMMDRNCIPKMKKKMAERSNEITHH